MGINFGFEQRGCREKWVGNKKSFITPKENFQHAAESQASVAPTPPASTLHDVIVPHHHPQSPAWDILRSRSRDRQIPRRSRTSAPLVPRECWVHATYDTAPPFKQSKHWDATCEKLLKRDPVNWRGFFLMARRCLFTRLRNNWSQIKRFRRTLR